MAVTEQDAASKDVSRTEDLTWAPAWKIRDLVAAKEVSPVEVTEHFLGRIEQLEPTIHAFRKVDAAGAREQARASEAAILRGEPAGALQGVPISVKEHIAIKGLPIIPFGEKPQLAAPNDDIIVERLRRAGAIMIGTNVMPGMGNSPLSPKPMDLASEHPRNPWDPTRVPGSSSAGGAAATAAAMLPLTIGSDGGGSTRLPAALSGVIGVHPSRGRIPDVHYAAPQLRMTVTNGPLTRNVRDAATVMQAVAGPDGRDIGCIDEPAPDYLAELGKGVEGLRLAWTDDFGYASMYALEQSPAVIAAVRQAAQGFASLGAKVEPTSEAWEDFWPGYVATSQAYREGPMAGPTPDAATMQSALETRGRNWDRFQKLFGSCDLLLSPTIQFTAFTVEGWDAAWNREGAKYPHSIFAPTYTSHTHMFNWLGWPAVSIPCGFVSGLPIGLQIIAPPRREALIYRAAAAFLDAYPRNERPKVS